MKTEKKTGKKDADGNSLASIEKYIKELDDLFEETKKDDGTIMFSFISAIDMDNSKMSTAVIADKDNDYYWVALTKCLALFFMEDIKASDQYCSRILTTFINSIALGLLEAPILRNGLADILQHPDKYLSTARNMSHEDGKDKSVKITKNKKPLS